MSRALLKLSGGPVHDYATISDDSPTPSRASRAPEGQTLNTIATKFEGTVAGNEIVKYR